MASRGLIHALHGFHVTPSLEVLRRPSWQGHHDTVAALLTAGADVEGEQQIFALHVAVDRGCLDKVEFRNCAGFRN